MADFEYMIASDKRRIANCKQKSRIGKNVVIKTRIIVRYRIWFVIMSDNKKTGKTVVVPLYMKRNRQFESGLLLFCISINFGIFLNTNKRKEREKIGGY